MKCPVCGGIVIIPDFKEQLHNIYKNHPIKSTYNNPGGAEIEFVKEGRIQISAWCDSCDLTKIRRFLRMPEDHNMERLTGVR